MPKRWTRRPAGSNWGDFGDNDQIGRLNLLTPQKRLEAAKEIKLGKVFCLSLPLDVPGPPGLTPNRKPPQQQFTSRRHNLPSVNYPLRHENPAYTDVSNDDSFMLFTQYSTQWDSLAHLGQVFDIDGTGHEEVVYYNGYRGGRDICGPGHKTTGATALGIDKMAETGVQGRGVIIDLYRHFNTTPAKVGFKDLQRIIDDDGINVEPGDLLCLHTGYARRLLLDGTPTIEAPHSGQFAMLDGRDNRLLDWVRESGIAALIADNIAIEAYPNDIDKAENATGHYPGLPLHETCLFKLGIHLGELWYLSELNDWLRANNRYRFFLTCPPLRLPCAFGSPVTPVATV